MKIRADLLKVRNAPRDDAGQRVEPEAQPVSRVLVTEFPASMQGSNVQKGVMQGEIVIESTAGEIAKAMRRPCLSCKHFNRSDWKKCYVAWDAPTAPVDKRKQLNAIRAMLLETSNAKIIEKSAGQDGEMDVEHAMSLLGVCRPLSEVHDDVVIVHPTGGCPENVCTKDMPHGFYEAKDRANERQGSAVFDRVMRLAQGAK